MNTISKISVAMLVLVSTWGFAQDADAHGRINNRQCKQKGRIVHGVKSGALTKRETLGLASQQAKLARAERRMRQSGDGLTLKERARLEHRQDHLSRNIYRQKNDNQTR